jgi:hypothetical protein
VQFLAQELVIISHTTYPKIGYRDSWILSYGRFWFFTFLFFMLKISRIRLCEYNKSCSIFHHESNKVEFAFFSEFSTIFYAFYKFQQMGYTIEDVSLR